MSNIKFSKKKFESYYRQRWQIESEIKVLKSLGLESYMVRKLRAIRLWIMAGALLFLGLFQGLKGLTSSDTCCLWYFLLLCFGWLIFWGL